MSLERAGWFDEEVKNARLRQLVNRKYIPGKPRWVLMFLGFSYLLMLAVFGIGCLLFPPTKENDTQGLISGVAVGGVLIFDALLWLFYHICASLSYVSLEEDGLLVKSACARFYARWEDISPAFLVRDKEGDLSYPTLSMTVYTLSGRRARISSLYDIKMIASNIDQILAIVRGVDTDKPLTELIVEGGDGGI